MSKSPDAFRTISEVAAWLGIQAHVLRFWESKFTQVKPVKRAGGRRYYRPADMRLIGGIKTLLHDDGMTIKGVQKILREQGAAHVAALSPALDGDHIEAEIDAGFETGTVVGIDAGSLAEGETEETHGGTVLAFKAKPATAAPARPAASATPPAGPATQPPLPLSDMPQPEPTQPEPPEQVTAAETPAETPPETTEAAGSDAPARPAAPAEPAALPSFLSPSGAGSAMATPPQPQVAATAAPAAEPEPPYTPGLLGHLAGIAAVTPDQAARIAPLARALRDWYGRQTKAVNG